MHSIYADSCMVSHTSSSGTKAKVSCALECEISNAELTPRPPDNSHFETYTVAGRRIGTGLTATSVVASWAWSTALLSSAVVTYNYGVAGAYWFGAGCVVQISFFSLLAIQSKKKAPHAHTLLEIVRARYGTLAHQVS